MAKNNTPIDIAKDRKCKNSIIKLRMRDNRGIQTEKRVELIPVKTVKDEYLHVASILCDKC